MIFYIFTLWFSMSKIIMIKLIVALVEIARAIVHMQIWLSVCNRHMPSNSPWNWWCTCQILKDVEQDLSGFKCGLAHFFCKWSTYYANVLSAMFDMVISYSLWILFSVQHTSASLTINENYDSDVRDDTETFLNRIVPEVITFIWCIWQHAKF